MKIVGEVRVVVVLDNIGCVVISRELSVDGSFRRGSLVGRTRGLSLGPCRGRSTVHDDEVCWIATRDETAGAKKRHGFGIASRELRERGDGSGMGTTRYSDWGNGQGVGPRVAVAIARWCIRRD